MIVALWEFETVFYLLNDWLMVNTYINKRKNLSESISELIHSLMHHMELLMQCSSRTESFYVIFGQTRTQLTSYLLICLTSEVGVYIKIFKVCHHHQVNSIADIPTVMSKTRAQVRITDTITKGALRTHVQVLSLES